MLHTILVPLDGSELAEHALACAEGIAGASSARLILMRVVPFDIIQPPEDDFATVDESRAYLTRIASGLTARGRAVTTVTKWGRPDSCILDELETQGADLLVIGTHGRSAPGRWLYGSVADAVLRASPVPTIVVPPAATLPGRCERILVPLDGSTLAEAALPPVVEMAKAFGAELVLLEVVPRPAYAFHDEGAMTPIKRLPSRSATWLESFDGSREQAFTRGRASRWRSLRFQSPKLQPRKRLV